MDFLSRVGPLWFFINNFFPPVVHASEVMFEIEWLATHSGAKLILPPLKMQNWAWPSMNQYRMFFIQTSTLPPSMHQQFTKYRRCCMQINQLPTKGDVEWEDNSSDVLLIDAELLDKWSLAHTSMNLCAWGLRFTTIIFKGLGFISTKLNLTLVIASLLACTHRSNSNDLFTVVGALYGSTMFISFNNCGAVQPVVSVERTVFYREKAAGLYSAMPYAMAQASSQFSSLHFIQD